MASAAYMPQISMTYWNAPAGVTASPGEIGLGWGGQQADMISGTISTGPPPGGLVFYPKVNMQDPRVAELEAKLMEMEARLKKLEPEEVKLVAKEDEDDGKPRIVEL